MKKILSIIIFSFVFCNMGNAAIYGKGELKMSDRAVNDFIDWVRTKQIYKGNRCKPSMFIMSSNGIWTQGNICCYTQCQDTYSKKIVEDCERETGVACGVFSIRRTIYWTNDVNTKKDKLRVKSKWSDQKIIEELKRRKFID